jgi:glyoxylase-like metal-dependent hydrolase (beta-lactamase superfamily II)
MKTVVVTANAHQLTRWGFVNCYLIREADGLTLVDTGLAGSEADILGAVARLGASLRRIVLTHAHVDHVGSVDALIEKLGPANVELMANSRTLTLLQKPPDTSLMPGGPQDKIKGGLPGMAATPPSRPPSPKQELPFDEVSASAPPEKTALPGNAGLLFVISTEAYPGSVGRTNFDLRPNVAQGYFSVCNSFRYAADNVPLLEAIGSNVG